MRINLPDINQFSCDVSYDGGAMGKFALIEQRYSYLIRIIVYVITGCSSSYSVPNNRLSNGDVFHCYCTGGIQQNGTHGRPDVRWHAIHVRIVELHSACTHTHVRTLTCTHSSTRAHVHVRTFTHTTFSHTFTL